MRETAEGRIDSPLGDLCLLSGYIQRMQRIIRHITNTIPKIAVNTETTERVFGFEYSNVTFICLRSIFVFVYYELWK